MSAITTPDRVGGDTSCAASLAIVVIARNEGARLKACVAALRSRGDLVIHVDSGSTDGSQAWARGAGIDVVELDAVKRFSAARARNAGAARARELKPDVEFVQFVDGDCVLEDGWLEAAVRALRDDESLAAVCGALRERYPESSVYSAFCDVEWERPAGFVPACGGVFMTRAAMFTEVGGFDETVLAGEEPELCDRFRERGWRIRRLPVPMATHECGMHRFAQWWRRQLRTGRFDAEISERFGGAAMRKYRGQVRSARLWCAGWLASLGGAATAVFAANGHPAVALAGLAVAAVVPAQALRIAVRTRRRGRDWSTSLSYGALTMVSKWAHVAGQLMHATDRAAGRSATLIEYRKGHDPTLAAGTERRS